MRIKKISRYGSGSDSGLKACGTLDQNCGSPSVDGICPSGGDSGCIGIDGDCNNPDQSCVLAWDECGPTGDFVACSPFKHDVNIQC